MHLGEMEKDCLYAHGSMSIFKEKLMDDSDGFNFTLCKCGKMANYN